MRSIIRPLFNQYLKRFASTNAADTTLVNQLRFDNRTAIITGAGRGLGREYALLLASRGANLMLNDLGSSRAGESLQDDKAEQAADSVADEIRNKWPNTKVITNSESVAQPDGARRIVESALNEFGQIDILINNAGILRDRSFVKISFEDWEHVQAVHLRGSFLMSKACWSHMRKQDYGKIIMTSSTSGLFGNFGQANYSAAKMGLIGLSNTLAIEGQRNNIRCNTIVPMAASRMTHDVLPEDVAKELDPAFVAPLVAWLCHERCTETGGLFEAAGQWFGQYRLQRSKGQFIPELRGDNDASIEKVAASWDSISRFDEQASCLNSSHEHIQHLLQSLGHLEDNN